MPSCTHARATHGHASWRCARSTTRRTSRAPTGVSRAAGGGRKTRTGSATAMPTTCGASTGRWRCFRRPRRSTRTTCSPRAPSCARCHTHETHLLASSSVVRSVSYARDRVSYTTFADSADDVLRLRFRPATVIGGTFTVEPAGGGDYVVRIRHGHARRITLTGAG